MTISEGCISVMVHVYIQTYAKLEEGKPQKSLTCITIMSLTVGGFLRRKVWGGNIIMILSLQYQHVLCTHCTMCGGLLRQLQNANAELSLEQCFVIA